MDKYWITLLFAEVVIKKNIHVVSLNYPSMTSGKILLYTHSYNYQKKVGNIISLLEHLFSTCKEHEALH